MELLRSPFDTEECLDTDEALRRECDFDDFEDDFERRDAALMSFVN